MNEKRWPFKPHVFINEDGLRFQHEGYEYKKCQKCGDEFVVGKNVANQYPLCLPCEKGLKQYA